MDHSFSYQVSGNVTYCGHQLSEFIPQRTCAYISPYNLHTGEMTVRETLDFSRQCLGIGPRYKLLREILKTEKEAGTKRDCDTDAFMDGSKEMNLITDYVLKVCCINFVSCFKVEVSIWLRWFVMVIAIHRNFFTTRILEHFLSKSYRKRLRNICFQQKSFGWQFREISHTFKTKRIKKKS